MRRVSGLAMFLVMAGWLLLATGGSVTSSGALTLPATLHPSSSLPRPTPSPVSENRTVTAAAPARRSTPLPAARDRPPKSPRRKHVAGIPGKHLLTPPRRHAVAIVRRKPAPLNVYAATLTGKLSPRVVHIPERVYVPNSGDGSVTVIDPRTFRVVDHFFTGAIPHHIAPSWDLQRLYVDNEQSSTLTVIDPRTGKPASTIPVPFPYNLYFTPDGSKAIVVVERLSRLDFRDPHTWALKRSVPIPWPGVDHLDFSADGRYLIASTEWSGMVVKVDIVAMRIVGQANVGGLPIDVRLSPDGSVFYVANQGRGGVSIVDPQEMKEVGFLHTGAGAHGLAVSRDAQSLYVTNRLAGTISVISFKLRKVTATWSVGGHPDMIQLSPDGRQLWETGRFDGTVDVIDTQTGKVLHIIPVGFEPHGLCYFPNVGRFSLGHNGVYR